MHIYMLLARADTEQDLRLIFEIQQFRKILQFEAGFAKGGFCVRAKIETSLISRRIQFEYICINTTTSILKGALKVTWGKQMYSSLWIVNAAILWPWTSTSLHSLF